ncbi:hypothetical protein [Pseudalkalibacillus sp. SCS-8]|uniref:hypothetical protein n=1 Tax=Pseudalkalibacillus nanhaiensis TaxID=3115291 RepID=UPI0032D9E488
MRKGILPLVTGFIIAFSIFWFSHPAGTSTYQVNDLPKKSFAKSHINVSDIHSTAASQVSSDTKVKTITTEAKTDHENPTKGDFIKLADSFMTEMIQSTNEDGKVTSFETKDQLIEHMKDYASSEVTEYYVDGLYEEKSEGLYIIPTELPPWIVTGEPSELKKLDDEHYQLKQVNETDLYGTYTIQIDYSKKDSKWIITSVNVK